MSTPEEYTRHENGLLDHLWRGKILSSEMLHKVQDTQSRNQHYTPERLALHEKICEALIPKNATRLDQPFLIGVGGGPASGKSSIVHIVRDSLEAQGIHAVYISNEDIRKFLPEMPILRKGRRIEPQGERRKFFEEAHGFFDAEINDIRQEIVRQAAARHLPLVIESHMHTNLVTIPLIQAAQEQGYQTLLLQPDIDLETYDRRGHEREQATGKPFMGRRGFARHILFEKEWMDYSYLFDVAVRFDNNNEKEPPKPFVVTLRPLQTGRGRSQFFILNEERYFHARKKETFSLKEAEETHGAGQAGVNHHYKPNTEEMGRGYQGDLQTLLNEIQVGPAHQLLTGIAQRCG